MRRFAACHRFTRPVEMPTPTATVDRPPVSRVSAVKSKDNLERLPTRFGSENAQTNAPTA